MPAPCPKNRSVLALWLLVALLQPLPRQVAAQPAPRKGHSTPGNVGELKTPAAKTPAAKQPAAKTPAAKTPAAKQPAAKTPAFSATSKPLATAALGARRLELHALPEGRRALLDRSPGDALLRIPCGDLQGAWGLWVTDVNDDGRPDLVITLLKKARFDPVIANRLHVYTLAGGQCVPLWRGTRLAGRFSALRPQGPLLFVQEVVGQGRQRLARYRWSGFGYTMERVIWQGSGKVPEALLKRHLSQR